MLSGLPEYPKSGISPEQEKYIIYSLTNLSPTFLPNNGQFAETTQFFTIGAHYCFHFTPTAVKMSFIERPAKQTNLDHRYETKPETVEWHGMALFLRFIEANPSVNIEGREEELGSINFFIGNNAAKWRTNQRSYAELVYRELWPGIDLVFRKAGGVLTYEFILHPGADITNIRLTYDGADDISLDDYGNLLIHTPLGILSSQRPASYQPNDKQCLPVTTEFNLERQTGGTFAFGFTADTGYAPHYPLVIGPGLVYSSHFGGSDDNIGYAIVVDDAGNAFVSGYTNFPAIPATSGTFQPPLKSNNTAFVTKINPTSSAIIYSTYFGGNGEDSCYGIVVDATGSAYMTGRTYSTDFPTTLDASLTTLIGNTSAFVTKINPVGSALIYSSYLSDINLDCSNSFVVDDIDNAYVTSGSEYEGGYGIAVDATGSAYVTAQTYATVFPATPGAFHSTLKSNITAFVTKINPADSVLIYSTNLGGSSDNIDFGIVVVDASDNCYITGYTSYTDFPLAPNTFRNTLKDFENAFITKINAAGSVLIYSTYLGGNKYDEGYGIVVGVPAQPAPSPIPPTPVRGIRLF